MQGLISMFLGQPGRQEECEEPARNEPDGPMHVEEETKQKQNGQSGDCKDGGRPNSTPSAGLDDDRDEFLELLHDLESLLVRSEAGGEQHQPDQAKDAGSSQSGIAQTGDGLNAGAVLHRYEFFEPSFLEMARLQREACKLYVKGKYRDAEQQGLQLLEVAQHSRDVYFQAAALRVMGDSQESVGEYREALHSFKRMLALPQDPHNEKTIRSWAHDGIGNAHNRLEEYKTALDDFTESLDIAKQLGDERGQGKAYGNIGNSYHGLGLYTVAIDYHKKHFDISAQLCDKLGQGTACGGLGSAHHDLCQYKKAIEYHFEHHGLAQQLQDKSGQGTAFGNIGAAYCGLGLYQKAVEYHWKHIEIAQQLDDTAGQGRAYNNLGSSYDGLGLYKTAIDCHQRSLSIAEQLGDRAGQRRAYGGLGSAYRGLGQCETAIAQHRKELEISVERNDKAGQGAAYGNLGKAHAGLGQHKMAIGYHQQCLDIAQQLRDRPGQAAAYGNLGSAHHGLGLYKAAIEYHQQKLDISMELQDELGQGVAYGNLGNVYSSLGQYVTAIELYKKKLKISVQLEDRRGQGIAYANLGAVYAGLDQHKTAIEYAEKHLDIAQRMEDGPGQAAAYGNLGVAYRNMGLFDAAIECHRKKLKISTELDDKSGQADAFGNLGKAYASLGKYETAIDWSLKHLEIATQLQDAPGQRRANGDLGVYYAHSGDYRLACCHFATSDGLLRELEAQLAHEQWHHHLLPFAEAHARFMDEWVVAAARWGDMAQALRAEEQRRCRSELAQQANMRGRLGGADVEVSADGLRTMAIRADAAFIVVIKAYDDVLLTWVLSGETGELVYARNASIAGQQDEIAGWVVSVTFAEWRTWQEQLQIVRQRIENERQSRGEMSEDWVNALIEDLLPIDIKGDMSDDLWNSIRDPSMLPRMLCEPSDTVKRLQGHFFTKAEIALEKLSKLLWEPVLEECQALRNHVGGDTLRDKAVYFLPDPFLSPIPFVALKTGGRPLIQKACVAQASSLRTLYRARVRWDAICNTTKSPPEALIVSYENPLEVRFSLLEHFEELTEILPAEILFESDVWIEDIIERVTSGTASLVHFLSHGTPGNREEDWAGLCLALDEVLSARELDERFAEKNPGITRLLVLCAGSSGRGLPMREGVQGFARAAQTGGIPCLIAAKWDIPARESIILLTRMYALMAMNKGQYRTVAQAMQAAIASYLQDHNTEQRHSFYYWAGFIPHGFADVKLEDELLDEIHQRLHG